MPEENIPLNIAQDKNFIPQSGAVFQPQENTQDTQTFNFMHKRDKTHCLVKINKAEFYDGI